MACLKAFPKKFRNGSKRTDSDYGVTYRRRAPGWGGEQAARDCRVGRRSVSKMVDISWVVPYNGYVQPLPHS